jgi:mannose-6-phosphate isomerase-like protein (cupin superfamily)
MDNVKDYIESGILELYVMGSVSLEETAEVERMAKLYPQVQTEIDIIIETFQTSTILNTKKPIPNVKALVMATIDYTERIKNGETPSNPPILTALSTKEDYAEWLNRSDLQLVSESEDMYGKIIGFTEKATTLITWLKTGAPFEVHENQLERFLILEGTCQIEYANGEIHHLKAGNFIEIPLFMGHTLTVTSSIPCKVILQRVAA